MNKDYIIKRLLEIIDRDGKNGKDLTIGYIIKVLEEILKDN